MLGNRIRAETSGNTKFCLFQPHHKPLNHTISVEERLLEGEEFQQIRSGKEEARNDTEGISVGASPKGFHFALGGL